MLVVVHRQAMLVLATRMARALASRAATKKVEPAVTTGLSKPRASERLRGLLRQRKALLTKIKQEQKQRERLAERARDTMTAMMSQVQPLFAKRDELSAAIHQLFRELLAKGRLPTRSRRQVEQVYQSLQDLLGAASDPASDPSGPPDPEHEESHAREFHHSASDGNGGNHKASVRDIFRRLALALHPDRATNEDDRRDRTEVMKQLTQAFEAGDLAALLEAEQRWLSGDRHPASGLDFDAQCCALERALADLKDQLRLLRADVKELKRSPAIAMAQATQERKRGAPADIFGEAVAEAEAELQALSELSSFVTAFRDEELSLAEFLRGPPSFQTQGVDIADLLFDVLEEDYAPPRRDASRRRRGAGVPF